MTDNIIGESAVQRILGWRTGRVVEVAHPPKAPRTITTHWQSLLLNAAHHLDQERAGTDENLAVGE